MAPSADLLERLVHVDAYTRTRNRKLQFVDAHVRGAGGRARVGDEVVGRTARGRVVAGTLRVGPDKRTYVGDVPIIDIEAVKPLPRAKRDVSPPPSTAVDAKALREDILRQVVQRVERDQTIRPHVRFNPDDKFARAADVVLRPGKGWSEAQERRLMRLQEDAEAVFARRLRIEQRLANNVVEGEALRQLRARIDELKREEAQLRADAKELRSQRPLGLHPYLARERAYARHLARYWSGIDDRGRPYTSQVAPRPAEYRLARPRAAQINQRVRNIARRHGVRQPLGHVGTGFVTPEGRVTWGSGRTIPWRHLPPGPSGEAHDAAPTLSDEQRRYKGFGASHRVPAPRSVRDLRTWEQIAYEHTLTHYPSETSSGWRPPSRYTQWTDAERQLVLDQYRKAKGLGPPSAAERLKDVSDPELVALASDTPSAAKTRQYLEELTQRDADTLAAAHRKLATDEQRKVAEQRARRRDQRRRSGHQPPPKGVDEVIDRILRVEQAGKPSFKPKADLRTHKPSQPRDVNAAGLAQLERALATANRLNHPAADHLELAVARRAVVYGTAAERRRAIERALGDDPLVRRQHYLTALSDVSDFDIRKTWNGVQRVQLAERIRDQGDLATADRLERLHGRQLAWRQRTEPRYRAQKQAVTQVEKFLKGEDLDPGAFASIATRPDRILQKQFNQRQLHILGALAEYAGRPTTAEHLRTAAGAIKTQPTGMRTSSGRLRNLRGLSDTKLAALARAESGRLYFIDPEGFDELALELARRRWVKIRNPRTPGRGYEFTRAGRVATQGVPAEISGRAVITRNRPVMISEEPLPGDLAEKFRRVDLTEVRTAFFGRERKKETNGRRP